MNDFWIPVFLLTGGAIALIVLCLRWMRFMKRRPRFESVEELTEQKFTLAEASLKLLEQNELLNIRTKELEDQKLLLESNRSMLEQQKLKLADVNRRLFELNEELEQEKEKSERLVRNILPPHVADALKKQGYTEPEIFENTVVMFTDFVDFTEMSSHMSPGTLIRDLNELFTGFDNIIEKNHGERIKTIGDAYLAISMPTADNPNPVATMLDSALDILTYLEDYNRKSEQQWRIRIGIHTGSIVGGVVGIKKYIYDIFGDTVNTAARLEQHCEEMRINVSDAVRLAAGEHYRFISRDPLEVKGKGTISMFFLDGKYSPRD